MYSYSNIVKTIIVKRVSNGVRGNDVGIIKPSVEYVIDFLLGVNRIENIKDDNVPAAKDVSGLILNAKDLGALEIHNIFKALILPRSIRFDLNSVPKHPDLKDYKSLGGPIQLLDINMSDLKEHIYKLDAVLSRNRISNDKFQIHGIWKDQTIYDVINCITLEINRSNVKEWLFSNLDGRVVSMLCPIIDISNVISTFNFTYGSNEFSTLFSESFNI